MLRAANDSVTNLNSSILLLVPVGALFSFTGGPTGEQLARLNTITIVVTRPNASVVFINTRLDFRWDISQVV